MPFISQGFVSETGEEDGKVPVTILRDMVAHYSVLPLSEETSCCSDLLVWGIKTSVLRVPLHMVCLRCGTRCVKVAVCLQLPISSVSFILGNDLAGGQVFPSPEVVHNPSASLLASNLDASVLPNVLPACAITCTEACKMGKN